MPTIPEALAIALRHRQAGRLGAAEQIYRRILAAAPNQAEAWHFLGVLALQRGQPHVAAEHIGRAITLKGDVPAFHNNLGEAHRASGRIPEAVACYRRALELDAGFADATCNLGNALQAQGRLDEAVAACRWAVELRPGSSEAHTNLGGVLKAQGKLGEAVTCYRRAIELEPAQAEPHYNLGAALIAQGNLDGAIDCYRRALLLKPDLPEAHNALGVALKRAGKLDEAIACYRRAIDARRGYAQAYSNLGNALREQGNLAGAVACCRQALKIKPDMVEAHTNLGAALGEQGELIEAITCCHRALELNADHPPAHVNLGGALWQAGRLDEALACFERALQLTPNDADAMAGRGNCLRDQGRHADAVAALRQAVATRSDRPDIHSALLVTLHFCPDLDASAVLDEHRRWNDRYAAALAGGAGPHTNDRDPERRLRVGYVSPNFCFGSESVFTLPLLEAHDHGRFEVVCYSGAHSCDDITERIRAVADAWRDVSRLADDEVARLVRADGIDILVDLAMHMRGSRLLAFARRPAPVQVTYLALPGTTGLTAIDYRLTDPYLDPPSKGDECYAERSIRLPDSFWCYRPLITPPPVGPLPATAAGHVTFGCLNNFCKVTTLTLAAWGRLLRAVPHSHLLLHARPGSHRERVQQALAEHGVSHERLEFVGTQPTTDYYRAYQRIDIALDPFPYGGGTTTCDALWMGVPAVSLRGKTAVGRGGLSILSNIGLPELVAHSADEYAGIAAELAGDLTRLAALRASLRERLEASPLMDAPRFARSVEAAYRHMWRRWCGRGGKDEG